MTTYLGLLRAVNLGAYNRVAMSDLRDLLTGLGMHAPRSLLQSGNLVFGSDSSSTSRLEGLLQDAAATRLGLETDFFVRTAKEWEAVLAGNPFVQEAERDPGHLLVMFLKAPPDKAAMTALQKAIKGREVVRVRGREAYITYPDGIGRSHLTTAMIETRLGVRGTGRNWNTIVKLGALAGLG